MFWDWWLAYPFDSFLLKTIKFFAFGFILILIVIIFCHGIVQSNSEKLLSPSQKVNLYTLTRFRKSRKPWEYYIPDMYRFIIIFLLILILLIPTASRIKMKDFEYEISTPMPETGLTLNLNDIFDKQLKETVSEDIKILPELEENN
ncbi:MAG: hypothetical protein M1269_06490 [Chloroflexi bacterium]|nr:hypothetical protein [Chloroflexota bacterium]